VNAAAQKNSNIEQFILNALAHKTKKGAVNTAPLVVI
jgi:uncharacterized protein (DUF1778 family)